MTSPSIPPLRFPLASPDLGARELRRVTRALRAGHVSGAAPEVAEFESACGAALASPHALAVSSGTAALHLALAGLGVGPGDEVIVPDLTYVAAANVVRYVGATPVLVDVDGASWTLDPLATQAAISPRTKAILAVHVYGNPADLDALGRLARRHRVALIEDAAEAWGARWRGRPVGTLGQVGCYSFFANKVITTGEGGLVTTRSRTLARTMRALRDQAKSSRQAYFHAHLGFNYRLSALQAALGLAQLERQAEFLAKRDRIRAWYREALAGVEPWREPAALPGAEPVNWLYSGTLTGFSRRRRDRCLERLRGEGIDARPLFVPMSALPEFRAPRLPVAKRIADTGLSLPVYPGLRRRDVAAIAAALRRAL